MDKIRRTPQAIIKSFEMDPDKRAVYVEGQNDRLFFEYVFEDQIDEQTVFLEISTVDLPEVDKGGNRGRLIEFAKQISESGVKIKCFVDADSSRILHSLEFPHTIILTDFRDLEGYLYERSYINKFIKVGLKTEKITPEYLLDEISKAREIAILRLCSEEKEYKFPFNQVNKNLHRYYQPGQDINLKKYIAVLLQKCDNKPTDNDFKYSLEQSTEKCRTISDRDLLHGKDVLRIIKEIASTLGLKKDNVELVFWMSFDRADVGKFPALKEVDEFLK